MADPSVSNITQLDPSDANTWTAATVGNADGPISDLAVSQAGINPPNTCSTFENSSATSTVNLKHSAYSPAWTAVDISAANQAILLHFAGNPGQFNRVSTDADAITMYAFDSGGARTTNYRYWELGGSNDKFYAGAANFFPVLLFSAGATAEVGTLDETAIVEIGTAFKPRDTGSFGVDFRIDQILYINGEVSFDAGDGTTAGTFARYHALLKADAATGSVYSAANEEIRPFYGWGYPVRMNSVVFEDSNFTFAFLPQDSAAAFNPPATGYYSLSINPSAATATHSYTDGVFAYDSGTYELNISAASLTSGTITMTRCSFLNAGAVTIAGAQLTMAACTITNPTSCSIAGASLDLAINNSAAAIQWTADLVAGSTITTDSDIDITFAETNLSDINIALAGVATISVSPITAIGTYDLSGLTSGSVVKLWNKSTSNATTIAVAGVTTQKIDLWFDYDTESGGPFVEGETLTFGNGATATLRTLVDNGATGEMYCTYLAGTTPPDNSSITGGTSAATALVNEAAGANRSTLTISAPATSYTLQLPSIINNSRFQVINESTAVELTNSTTSGGTGISETYTAGVDYTAGDTGRYRVAYQSGTTAKELIEGTFTFPASTATNSIPTAQVDQPTYNTRATDGSAVTGISWDSGNMQFDFNELDDIVDGQDVGAWYYYYVTTAVGIDEVFGAFSWNQVNKLTNVTGKVAVTFDNVSLDPLRIINCWIERDDGATIISATSNSIQIDPPAVFAIETGVSGLTAPESAQLGLISTVNSKIGTPTLTVSDDIAAIDAIATDILVDTAVTLPAQISSVSAPTAEQVRIEIDTNSAQLAAIKAKTDALTFTVAGQVDANVQYVNDVVIAGTGSTGDEWGPGA